MHNRWGRSLPEEHVLAVVARLARRTDGVFRGRDAVSEGLSRRQIDGLRERGLVERMLPDTYRIASTPASSVHALRAALLWAGDGTCAEGASAGALHRLEGVKPDRPAIVVPPTKRLRSERVSVHRASRKVVMPRQVAGFPCAGIEFTLLRLAHELEPEAFEIAFEDARRRRLTSIPAIDGYLDRFAAHGRPGVSALRAALRAVDPVHPARSTLEVKTRRLREVHGIDGYVREHPLRWNGRTYRYDFAFAHERVIVETNGRRWHDDATDYERDQEKWSVPGRLGWRLELATWEKVTARAGAFVADLRAALAGAGATTRGRVATAVRPRSR